jgi:hypothetical protein
MNLASSTGEVLVGTHHTHILPGVSRMKASPELSIEDTSSTCNTNAIRDNKQVRYGNNGDLDYLEKYRNR